VKRLVAILAVLAVLAGAWGARELTAVGSCRIGWPLGRNVLVVYEASWPEANEWVLTVRTNGWAEAKGRDLRGPRESQTRLAPAQVERLRQLLESPEFAALEGRYRGGSGQKMTTRCPGGIREVYSGSNAERPQVLRQVDDELYRILAGLT
jgi:hypothetical protein